MGWIKYCLVLIFLVLLVWTNPTLLYLHIGSKQISQPNVVYPIWKDIQLCTGRFRSLGYIEWFESNYMVRIRPRGIDFLGGYWNPKHGFPEKEIRIIRSLTPFYRYVIIRHELLHHLGFRHEDFLFKMCEL